MPIQNYQSINSDIENINLNENEGTIYSNVRWNAFKNLIIHGFSLSCLCCVAALIDAYIENELTNDKFNSFWEFLKRTKTYLSWCLASIGFAIILDKTAFSYFDAVVIDVKELITGEKKFTNEEKVEAEIKELKAENESNKEKIKQLENNIQQNKEQQIDELKLFKENILKEVDEKIENIKFEVNREVIYTENLTKADSNYKYKTF